jgi:hypothetical protein
VEGLQFQDRLSQRIGHVIEGLAAMESALSGHAVDAGTGSAVLQELQKSYTMHSERAAHGGAGVATGEAAAEPDTGDVELF